MLGILTNEREKAKRGDDRNSGSSQLFLREVKLGPAYCSFLWNFKERSGEFLADRRPKIDVLSIAGFKNHDMAEISLALL